MESLQTSDRAMPFNRKGFEKGASNWLTALPLKRYGFRQTKSEFRNGFCIRDNIEAKITPINCPYVEKFALSHALHFA